MIKKILGFLLLLVLFAAFLPVSISASIFLSGDRYVVASGDTINDDIYVTSGEGLIKGVVVGDVVFVTKDYTISGEVTGNVSSGSQTATIRGIIGKSARIFAQRISVDGSIGHNLIAFGEDIEIYESCRIAKDATIFGGEISVAGIIDRDLKIDADQVVISGKINGNLTIEANKISIVTPAEITGDVIYTSKKEIRIDDDVIIGGEIEWNEIRPGDVKDKDDGIGGVLRFLLFLASLVTGLFIIALSNRHCRIATEHIAHKPLVSLGVGFVAFCLIPIAILVLAALIISIPVAVILLFAYTIFFYIAKIYVAIAIGRLGIRAFRKDVEPKQGWSLLFGLIVLSILFIIPGLGWIIYFVVIFGGIGAIILGIRDCRLNLQPNNVPAPNSTLPPVT